MTMEVRAIREDELADYLDAVTTGFLERTDVDKLAEEVRPHWDFARVWAAFEDGRVVGTTRTWPTELTLPGNRQVKAAAVSGVTVRPTHRRRGLLRAMIAAEHVAARERGEIVSLLYASDYPIYGRFGYGVAAQAAGWMLDLTATSFHEAAGGHGGSIEAVKIDDAAIETAREVFEAWRRIQPGEIWRRPIMWRSDFGKAGAAGDGWKGFLVLHRDDSGAVDGYARYHGDAKWEHRQPRSTLSIDELHGLTPDAQVALWRFVASIDLVTTLKAERRHPGDRLPWLLTNGRAAEPVEMGDGIWARLHDIRAALEARSYERTGALVLEVHDRDARTDGAPPSRVRIALDVSPEGTRATATERSPDLTIDGTALGAAFLGGTRLRDAVIAFGCDQHRAGALAEADALLATLDAPWCSTFF